MAEPVHTIADFLAVVRKSGLVEEDRLVAVAAPWPETDAPLPDELPRAFLDAGLLTEWQLEQLRRGKHKGFMLGKFRLLRLLGAGGMSSVYLAENPTLKKQVAIKILPVKRVEQSSFLARFEREARTAFQLGHQNIARAFDLETAGAIHFIVMEFIDGIDLHAKVKQDGPLEIRDAVEYLRQAAVGLHYAHEEGLVHRDIKPANLILDRKGNVKILDLGLALADDDDQDGSLTREHDEKVLGTADYLAPEQATDSHAADRRSDIYALGCTLHYLLIGRAPFAKGKLAERIQAHARRPAPNIVEERTDVPPAIADLYFRMMEKHPDARPQTAQEVADALARRPPGAPSPSAAPPLPVARFRRQAHPSARNDHAQWPEQQRWPRRPPRRQRGLGRRRPGPATGCSGPAVRSGRPTVRRCGRSVEPFIRHACHIFRTSACRLPGREDGGAEVCPSTEGGPRRRRTGTARSDGEAGCRPAARLLDRRGGRGRRGGRHGREPHDEPLTSAHPRRPISHEPSASASIATRRVRSKSSGVSVTSPAASAVTSDSAGDGGGGGSFVAQ